MSRRKVKTPLFLRVTLKKHNLKNHTLKGVPHEINGSFSLQKCWQMFHIPRICIIRMLLGLLDPDLGFRLPYGFKDPDPKEIITDTKHSD